MSIPRLAEVKGYHTGGKMCGRSLIDGEIFLHLSHLFVRFTAPSGGTVNSTLFLMLRDGALPVTLPKRRHSMKQNLPNLLAFLAY